MTKIDAYTNIIQAFLSLTASPLPVPNITAALPVAEAWPERAAGKKCALLFSPHPDDECLTGALPLRLKQEQGWQIINAAVTLGSDRERKAARLQELANACSLLGFDILIPQENGFSRINPETRDQSEKLWRSMVERVMEILTRTKPDAIFMPNIRDGHRTHIGTYYLVMDALAMMPADFTCTIAQTEYWQPNALPNMMVGLSPKDTATLLAALCCHNGENIRNAFNQRFPAYLSDNVRRGSERVGGQGTTGATFNFAMLYQVDFWQQGRLRAVPEAQIFAPDMPIKLPD